MQRTAKRISLIFTLAFLVSAAAWWRYRTEWPVIASSLQIAPWTNAIWFPGWVVVEATVKDDRATPWTDFLVCALSGAFWGSVGLVGMSLIDQAKRRWSQKEEANRRRKITIGVVITMVAPALVTAADGPLC